jgi:rubredoxin
LLTISIEEINIMRKWQCTVCGYIHEGEELPEDFVCPLCGVGAEDFEEIFD